MGYRKWPWERESDPEEDIGANDPAVYILETQSRKDVDCGCKVRCRLTS